MAWFFPSNCHSGQWYSCPEVKGQLICTIMDTWEHGHHTLKERILFLSHSAFVTNIFWAKPWVPWYTVAWWPGIPCKPALFPSLDWWTTTPYFGKFGRRPEHWRETGILGSWGLWCSTAQKNKEKGMRKRACFPVHSLSFPVIHSVHKNPILFTPSQNSWRDLVWALRIQSWG